MKSYITYFEYIKYFVLVGLPVLSEQMCFPNRVDGGSLVYFPSMDISCVIWESNHSNKLFFNGFFQLFLNLRYERLTNLNMILFFKKLEI